MALEMVRKAGTELQAGVTSVGITGLLEQSSTRKQLGTLKEYKDKDGNIVSVYVTGKGEEISFEAIMSSSVTDKEVGDTITIDSDTYYVTDWTVTESNEDAKKVSCTARTYPGVTTSSSQT